MKRRSTDTIRIELSVTHKCRRYAGFFLSIWLPQELISDLFYHIQIKKVPVFTGTFSVYHRIRFIFLILWSLVKFSDPD